MPRINCFDKIKHKDVRLLQDEFNAMVPEDTDLTEQEQKEIGKAIATVYYKKVNQQLVDLKNKIGIKSGAESEILPDRTKQIREIEDKYSILIKQELDNGKSNRTLSEGETQPERDTEIIISAAGVVINEARKARTEKEVDASLDQIEDALNEIESKVGKLTESWTTDDIEHETPSKVIGKQVKKEITKYAKEIARINGWVIPAKNGVYDNIAPAGGEVIFKFDIPGTPYQMYVQAKYEPEYALSSSYDNYTFEGFFYRLYVDEPGKYKNKQEGANQWLKQNITAKEMAQILQAEANKYTKPTISEIAAANKGRIIIGKVPFEFKPDQKEVDEYFDNSIKRYNEVDAKSKEALLKTVEGLVSSYEDNLKGLTADDYNESVRGLSRQKMKVQLEAGRKFLDHVKANKSIERLEKVDDDIDAAWAKFTKGDKGTFTSGGLTKEKIEAGVELIGLYMKKGIYKFSDIVEDAKKRLGESLADYFDSLKAVYSAYYHSQATEDEMYQMDQNVENYTLNNIQDASTNTGTGTTDKSQMVPPVDGVVEGQSQGTLSGVESGGKGTMGSEESSGSDRTTGRNGGQGIGQKPSGGISQGESDVAINGNDELNEELGGESVEQEVSQPKDQEPVVSPLQHNGNFIIPPDFTNSRSFNVAQKLQDNIDAIKTLIQIKAQGTKPTYEQQKILFKYVGWGGIKEIGFDPNSSESWVASNIGLRPKFKEVFDLIKELDEENYDKNIAAVQASKVNAHYTAIPVIRGIWNVLRKGGFKGGKIVEPSAGVGHFIGAMPIDIMQKSTIGAIELDNLTSQILKGLYPNHIVKNAGFEEVNTGGQIDLMISNIPFGNYGIFDKNFELSKDKVLKKSTKRVHTYFFARAIQDVKPNGVIAFVTSTGVMDAPDNKELREMMAERTEFLGAIRMPSDTFKGNANTQVTTDIIFLRKFADTEKAEQKHEFLKIKPAIVKHKNRDEKYRVEYNEYFHNNPEMMLGEVEAGSMYAKTAGEKDTMVLSPTGINIEEGITNLADKIFSNELKQTDNSQETTQAAQSFVKENGQRVGNLVQISDGVFGTYTGEYATDEALEAKARSIGVNPEDIRTDSLNAEDLETLTKNGLSTEDFKIKVVNPVRVPKKYLQAAKDLIPLREALNELYAAEFGDLGDVLIEQKRTALNNAYTNFKKNNGTLLENKALLELDIDGHNLQELEKREDKKVTGLADIFTKRVFHAPKRAETAADISDAITISLNEADGIDINRIAELLKVTPEEAIKQSEGILYKNPQGGFETKDKYLSGNVRQKLVDAKIAAEEDSFYDQNVVALEKAQPVDLNASQIYAPINAPWVMAKYLNEFASHIFKQDITVNRLKSGRTNVSGSSKNTEVTDVYGTPRRTGFELLEEAIQNKEPVVYDTLKNGDGSTTSVLNEKATQAAVEKVKKIRQEFDNWIWQDDDRRTELVDFYNKNFNNTKLRNYDGSHLKFDGYRGEHTPRPHQLDGVWMVMQQMGGILDHIVGSGKTLLFVLATQKMKQMGIIKKPIIMGLKANAAEIAKTYKNAFPLAKVLYPSEKDFTPANRRAFFAKMANNDWDAIVMTHTQFGMIEQSKEIQQEIIAQEIEELENDIREAKGTNMNKRQLNGLELRKLNLSVKLQSLNVMKKDTSLKTFEEMGIDFMFVDESQVFKNLSYTTIQDRVAGLGKPEGNKLTQNMLYAIRTLQKKWGADKGVVFASGTPISNSVVEMFSLFKYLRPNKLIQMGLDTFDRWANTFGKISSEAEFGHVNALKQKKRLREFANVPELSTMYREIADLRNDKNLSLPKPVFKKSVRLKTDSRIANGEIITIENTKFRVLGSIRGMEKDDFLLNLVAVGKDVKLPESGSFKYSGITINYSEPLYSNGLLVNVTPTLEQRKYLKRLQKFAQDPIRNHHLVGLPPYEKGKEGSAQLQATNLGAKMALDMRLIDPSLPDTEVGKLGVAADTILQHYKESEEHKGVQLVFSDLGTPKTSNTSANLFDLLESRGIEKDTLELIFGAGAYADTVKFPHLRVVKEKMLEVLEYTEDEFVTAVTEANAEDFNVYQGLKDKLVKRGIPADEIAFIHDYKSDKSRSGEGGLFDQVNEGKIRIVIGSTSKLGTGVNVQKRIVALHHLDVLWNPAGMEQRNGRGVRQGNVITRDFFNNELPVYLYATENTLDTYKYQLLGTKQNFIDQSKSESTVREISEGEGDEENGIPFAIMVALISGNPALMAKAKIDVKVKELDSLKKGFEQEKYSLKDKIVKSTRNAEANKEDLADYKKDQKLFQDNATRNEKTGEWDYAATIGGEVFDEQEKEPTPEELKEAETIKKLAKEFKKPEVGSEYVFRDGSTAKVLRKVSLDNDKLDKTGTFDRWEIELDGTKQKGLLSVDQLKARVTGQKKEKTVRQRAGEKINEIRNEFKNDYDQKYPQAKNISWYQRSQLPQMSRKIGEINGFNIMIRMAPVSEAMEKGGSTGIVYGSEVGVQSPVSNVYYKYSGVADPSVLAGHLQREIRDLQPSIDLTERNLKFYEKDAKEKQQYLETLPAVFPKQQELEDALAQQIKVDAILNEMTKVNLPTVEDLEQLGERIFDKVSEHELENVYAITEEGEVMAIMDAEQLADAQSENSRFYIYKDEVVEKPSNIPTVDELKTDEYEEIMFSDAQSLIKLDRTVYSITKDNKVRVIDKWADLVDADDNDETLYKLYADDYEADEEDDIDYQFANISSEEIQEMQEVVKEQIDLGNNLLEDIQNLVAKELDDDSAAMRQLVEEAYHEYGRGEDTPEDVVRGVIGRIESNLSAINGNGVYILPNTTELLKKAEELGNVEFHVKTYTIAGVGMQGDFKVTLRETPGRNFNKEGKIIDQRNFSTLASAEAWAEKEGAVFLYDYQSGKILPDAGRNTGLSGRTTGSVQNSEEEIQTESKAVEAENKINFQLSPEGKILGFTHNGKIYLNGKHLNPNTPIHENSHIVISLWDNITRLFSSGVENNLKEISDFDINAKKLEIKCP